MRLSLGSGAGARSSAARHRGRAWSAAALPSAPLLPLARTGAVAAPPAWVGALELSDTVLDEGAEPSCGAHVALAARQASRSQSFMMMETPATVCTSTSACQADIYTENVPFYTQRDPTLCQKRVCEPEEMQWCDDRNESRTASCQHQRVSPCEGQGKIFYNMNVTANFVGLNTECTGDFGAIAGVSRSVTMSDECYFSSSNGCLQECQYPSGCGTLPMDNENFTEHVPSHAERDLTLCQKRVCEFEEKQWCTDRNESGTTFGQQRQGCNKCDESRGVRPTPLPTAPTRNSTPTHAWTSASTKSTIFAEGDSHVTSLPGEVSDLGKTCPQQGDLSTEKCEDLLALLIAVRNELHDRGEDALVELVYQLMDRLLDDDTSEIANDARATIPVFTTSGAEPPDASISRSTTATKRTTAMKAMASLRWSTAPLSGTRQGAIQDFGVDLQHAVKVFELFAGWMVLREASISSVVPPLGHVKYTRRLGETERVLAVSETGCWPSLYVCWRCRSRGGDQC